MTNDYCIYIAVTWFIDTKQVILSLSFDLFSVNQYISSFDFWFLILTNYLWNISNFLFSINCLYLTLCKLSLFIRAVLTDICFIFTPMGGLIMIHIVAIILSHQTASACRNKKDKIYRIDRKNKMTHCNQWCWWFINKKKF